MSASRHFANGRGTACALAAIFLLSAWACSTAWAGESVFRRGDSNDDGNSDLADAVHLLQWRFLGGPAPSCQDAADFNDSGDTDIADSVFLLNGLFRGGPLPPGPGAFECGRDPTEDDLDCREYNSCDVGAACTENQDCDVDEYCDKDDGDCEGRGNCASLPEACTRIFDPVCGCDGFTYSNECVANAAGVSVLHRGPCAPDRCGGIAGDPCPEDHFCEFGEGECDIVDNVGVCVEIPLGCPDVVDPVCGCDGVTYSNDCDRQAAGVSKRHDGVCDAPDFCGGIAGIPCEEGEFCEFGEGECEIADAAGTCVATPDACIEIFDPVCGCDGVTYDNDCFRRQAGVSKDHDGTCESENLCGGFAGTPCDEGEFCQFAAGECQIADNIGTCVEIPLGCPDVFDPVCGCDGVTYGNDCERQAVGISKDHDGPCEEPVNDCGGFAGTPCERGEFCEFEPDTCDIADNIGECVAIPEACPAVFDPVCGCDGVTYGNDCERRMAGAQLAHVGACPE